MLATVPTGKRVFIEVKCGPEIVPELKRVIEASRLRPEQTAVISFSADVVAAVKQARPDLQAYWIVGISRRDGQKPPTADELISRAKAIKADNLDLSAVPDVLTPEFGRAIKDAGLAFHVWTVDDVKVARSMVAAGVDGITTNRPGQLREQLASADEARDLRVMSYNIRYASANDGEKSGKPEGLPGRDDQGVRSRLLGRRRRWRERDDLAARLDGYESSPPAGMTDARRAR